MCRKMSPLFRDREQQDTHEFLRCILLYVQEATRAINHQRAKHHNITKPDSRASSTSDADSTAGMCAKSCCLSESVSPSSVFQPHSAVRYPQPDSVDSTSPTGTTGMTARVSNITPEHDCLFNSSCLTSVSLQNPAPQESKPESAATTSSLAHGLKTTPSTGKITSYFTPAPPAPKTAAELTVTTTKVRDFVEALCEGKSEMTTRCLECECVTRCTETFQDVAVVAQKAVTAAKASNADPCDSDDDDGERFCA